jgi:hypothetical protein
MGGRKGVESTQRTNGLETPLDVAADEGRSTGRANIYSGTIDNAQKQVDKRGVRQDLKPDMVVKVQVRSK